MKLDVMYKCCYQKFRQNASLRNKLLSTGTSELIEASPWDAFWGLGKQGDGQNHLGKTLVRVREQLRKELEDPEEQKE